MKASGLCLAFAFATFLVGCGGGGDSGADSGQQPPPVTNTAPTANAGPIQNVLVGTTVTLDGSGSDANGDPLTYNWSLGAPNGSTASLSSGATPKPTFTADLAGTYVASLVVNDGKVGSTAATVTITATVANAAPVANAGPAQNVTTGTTVTLNGSASSDANGDALTFAWTLTSKPSGSAATLAGASSAAPTFTADLAGTYVASLVVNDGLIGSAASTVTITVVNPSLMLIEAPSSSCFFNCVDAIRALPYSTTATANTTCIGCIPPYEVAVFRLRASGSSYTITNVIAENLTSGSAVAPSIVGLVANQVISDGQTTTFYLQSTFTGGSTVNLRFKFTVSETSQTFTYAVQLRTN